MSNELFSLENIEPNLGHQILPGTGWRPSISGANDFEDTCPSCVSVFGKLCKVEKKPLLWQNSISCSKDVGKKCCQSDARWESGNWKQAQPRAIGNYYGSQVWTCCFTILGICSMYRQSLFVLYGFVGRTIYREVPSKQQDRVIGILTLGTHNLNFKALPSFSWFWGPKVCSVLYSSSKDIWSTPFWYAKLFPNAASRLFLLPHGPFLKGRESNAYPCTKLPQISTSRISGVFNEFQGWNIAIFTCTSRL